MHIDADNVTAAAAENPVYSAAGPSCSHPQPGVCLNAAKPILRIVHGTHDAGACCALCLNLSTCVSWHVPGSTHARDMT